ncbi:MAG: methyl-accepting chemotaxis protein, partial [Stenotrophomonas sp.]
VEEATAAARSMEDQATQLTEAVAVFRIAADDARKSSGKTAASAVAPPPRQRLRPVATSARGGQAALKMDDGDWQEF